MTPALEQEKSQDGSFVVVEQTFGYSESLNHLKVYGPFQSEKSAETFKAAFSWSRATIGLTVVKLKAS